MKKLKDSKQVSGKYIIAESKEETPDTSMHQFRIIDGNFIIDTHLFFISSSGNSIHPGKEKAKI
ncbi:MAG: hypothetical protein ABI462_06700 [Ignavibacteria bacterium]